MDQNPYHAPSATAAGLPAARPASLIVFGVINIVFGLIGLCGTAASSAMFFVDLPQDPRISNPALDLLNTNASYRLYLQVTTVIGALASLVLLAAGIGLLLAKAWGRTLSIGYGCFAIVFAVVGMIGNWTFVMKPMLAAAQEAGGPAAMGAVGGAVATLLSGIFSLIYPIVLLVFMNRPALRAAVGAAEPLR